MMTRKLCSVLGGMALAGAAAIALEDGSKGVKDQPAPHEVEAMMQEMEAFSRPGPEHAKLQEMVGTWDAAVKTWMGGPGSPAMESKGTSVNRSILGGRFILEEFKGTMAMPDPSGGTFEMPFEGMGTMGYDTFRKVFVGSWIDSMGTGMITYTGSMDRAGKEMNSYGTMDEPSMKVIGRMVRYRTRIIDRDHHVLEIFDLHLGPDAKMLEISYTRKP